MDNTALLNMLPLNISLLILNPESVRGLRPVKVLDIFDGFTKNFHPDGLFSIDSFGRVGEERRNRAFAYTNLNIPIFHPVIYKNLMDLKSQYEDIVTGKTYAVFDEKLGDFVDSNPLDGFTGFEFFVQNFKKIKFDARTSISRKFSIDMIKKNINSCMMDKLVVIPAGLRDYTVDPSGKQSEDEINGLYRKVIGNSNLIESIDRNLNIDHINNIRCSIQKGVVAVYDYLVSLVKGKSKFINDKWAGRKVEYSTRNVITAYVSKATHVDDERLVGCNESVVGLYQFLTSIRPLAVNLIRTGYLSNVFTGPNTPAMMVNKKTLKKEAVTIPPDLYDTWMTPEGLESVFSKYGERSLRNKVLEYKDHYFAMIYEGPDGTYKIFSDIDELPEGFDRKYVKPLNTTKLLYLSTYKRSRKIPGLLTRYPILGYGSIYPSFTYLKTTVEAEVRVELDHAWNKTESKAIEYPIDDIEFFDSLCPATSHLIRLSADFDGDTCSWTALLSDEAYEEIYAKLNSVSYYVGVDGKVVFSVESHIAKTVCAFIS